MKKNILFLALLPLLFSCAKTEDTNVNPDPNPNPDPGGGCVPQIVEVTNDITEPTVWSECHVYVISTTQISVKSSLTIQPGAVVKFKDMVYDNAFIVTASGSINALGTAAKPVIFTSYKDDLHGGDSNGDGNATLPGYNEWGGIVINSDNCTFKNCYFLYGGKGPDNATGQPSLEFAYSKGVIDSCLFAYCGGETTYNGYGVVDARFCVNPGFQLTNSIFYGCVKPVFINPAISIDNSNTFHNPADPAEKNQLNGIFVTSESNEATTDVYWQETEVPFVLTGSLFVGDGLKLILASDVIIKVALLPSQGYNKISFRDATSSITGHDLPGVFFTSYLDDAHGGDTNGDGNATSPSPGDWYGIQDYSATIPTNNHCYDWSNVLFAQYP